MLQAHIQMWRKNNSYLNHHLFKKAKKQLTYCIFYHEFVVLDFIRKDFNEPVVTLYLSIKCTHGGGSFSLICLYERSILCQCFALRSIGNSKSTFCLLEGHSRIVEGFN